MFEFKFTDNVAVYEVVVLCIQIPNLGFYIQTDQSFSRVFSKYVLKEEEFIFSV